MQLSRRAISRAHPELCDEELDLAFVAHHYGEKLADSLRSYLNQRHKDEGKNNQLKAVVVPVELWKQLFLKDDASSESSISQIIFERP